MKKTWAYNTAICIGNIVGMVFAVRCWTIDFHHNNDASVLLQMTRVISVWTALHIGLGVIGGLVGGTFDNYRSDWRFEPITI